MKAFTVEERVFSNKPTIVKIGGSCLTSVEDIREIADLILERSSSERLIIVVSAMKGETDNLLLLANSLGSDIDSKDLDQILSMGERTSARLLVAALRAKGVQTELIDPENKLWPIITDNKHGDANPDLELTRKEVLNKILPLLNNGTIPVVCGYLGRTNEGDITTLGRGGSDATAVLLGSCLNAKEIVLLKDVDGLLTFNPKKEKNAKLIRRITAEEAFILSSSGTKVIQPKALELKSKDTPIKIVGNNSSGTLIEGKLKLLENTRKPVALLTLLTKDTRILRQLGQTIAIVCDTKSITTCVPQENVENLVSKCHNLIEKGIVKAISTKENLGLIITKTNIESIHSLTNALKQTNIGIEAILTTLSSVLIFVKFSELTKAEEVIKEVLK